MDVRQRAVLLGAADSIRPAVGGDDDPACDVPAFVIARDATMTKDHRSSFRCREGDKHHLGFNRPVRRATAEGARADGNILRSAVR